MRTLSWHFITSAITLITLVIVAPSASLASSSGVTYQGRILKPDGSPLAGQFTQFKLQIRTPNNDACLMYEEIQSQDLRNSDGIFSLTINDGNGARTDTTGLTLDRIFANRGSFTLDASTCNSGTGVFAPGVSDGRNLVVLFKDETMPSWEPIPAQKINFVPYAFETKQIAGFTADSLLRVVNGSGDPLTGLAPLSNAQYTALLALVNGSSTAYTKAGELKGVAVPTMNAGEVLGWNGTAWVSTTSTPGANSITSSMLQSSSVGTSQIANNVSISTSGTLGAAITTTRDFKIYAASPSTFYVGMQAPALAASYNLVWPMTAGSASQVLTTDGAGNLTWTTPAGTGISALTGDVTATGTGSVAATVTQVGGYSAANVAAGATLANAATSANTASAIVKRDASGGFSAGAVSQASAVYRDSALNTVTVQAPTSVTSSYILKWPASAGSAAQVLTTDAAGNMSWTSPLTSSSAFVQGGNAFGSTASLGTNDNFDLRLRTNGATAMTLVPSGNVGIGTTSPGYKLDVSGAVNATSYKINGVDLSAAVGVRQDVAVGWVAVGPGANPSGSTSPTVALGRDSLVAGGGWGDVAIGANALNASQNTGWFNTAVGGYAASSLTSSHDVTAIGFNAAQANTTGVSNTAVGSIALQTNTTGSGNVAIGEHALYGTQIAANNVVVGTWAAWGAGTGQSNSNNVVVGTNAAKSIATGANGNTLVGYASATNLSTGTNNIMIGAAPTNANANLTTGSRNIAIGYDIALPSGTASNQLNIGNLVYGTGIDGTGSTLSTGKVGIGTTSPATKFEVVGSLRVGDGGETCAAGLTGAIRYNGGNLQFCNGTPPWTTLGISGAGISSLTGDVTATGPGAAAATVAQVGGVTAANVATGANLANAATNILTVNTIVKRDASGNFVGNVVQSNTSSVRYTEFRDNISNKLTLQAPANLSGSYTLTWPANVAASNGQVLTSNTGGVLSWTTPATSLPPSGAAGGDLSGTYPNPTVATVGAVAASDVATGANLANAATAASTTNAIVKRDGSGNFTANVATVNGVTLNNGGSLLNILNPIGGAWTMTLPATAGANGQVMQTNGSGVMSWATPVTTTTGFVNGGNTFGANSSLGNNDNFDLNLKTNNLNRLTVTSGGLVGIGTTAPTWPLEVVTSSNSANGGTIKNLNTGSAAKAQFDIQSDAGILSFGVNSIANGSTSYLWNGANSAMVIATNNTERIRIASGGNVAVGNTSPQAKFHVTGTTRLEGATTIYNGAVLALNDAGIDRTTSFQQVNDADFRITTSSGDFNIMPAGNVGIGTTAPAAALDIAASGNSLKVGSSSALGSSADFSQGRAIVGFANGSPAYAYLKAGAGHSLGFMVNNSAVPSVSVSATGNVGIGTTSPTSVLDVVGSATVSSSVISPVYTSKAAVPITLKPTTPTANSANGGAVTISGGTGSSFPATSGTGGGGQLTLNGGDAGSGGNQYAGPVSIYAGGSDGREGVDVTITGGWSGFDYGGNVNINGGPSSVANGGHVNITGANAGGSNANGGNITLTAGTKMGSGSNGRIALMNGNVGIGTTLPGYTLHVVGTAGLSTGTAWTNASDVRLKDIQGDYEYGLEEILKLHTVRYHYKKGNALGLPSDHPMTGFIAQEVQKVIPDAVHARDDGYLELNVDPIHWAGVNAIQQLHGMCQATEAKTEKNSAEIASLKRELASVKADNAQKTKELNDVRARLERIEKLLMSNPKAH